MKTLRCGFAHYPLVAYSIRDTGSTGETAPVAQDDSHHAGQQLGVKCIYYWCNAMWTHLVEGRSHKATSSALDPSKTYKSWPSAFYWLRHQKKEQKHLHFYVYLKPRSGSLSWNQLVLLLVLSICASAEWRAPGEESQVHIHDANSLIQEDRSESSSSSGTLSGQKSDCGSLPELGSFIHSNMQFENWPIIWQRATTTLSLPAVQQVT